MALFSDMREAKVMPDVISCNAGISACCKCGQWRQALSVLSELWESKLELDEISYNLGITAYERSSDDSAGFPGFLWIGLSRFRTS